MVKNNSSPKSNHNNRVEKYYEPPFLLTTISIFIPLKTQQLLGMPFHLMTSFYNVLDQLVSFQPSIQFFRCPFLHYHTLLLLEPESVIWKTLMYREPWRHLWTNPFSNAAHILGARGQCPTRRRRTTPTWQLSELAITTTGFSWKDLIRHRMSSRPELPKLKRSDFLIISSDPFNHPSI